VNEMRHHSNTRYRKAKVKGGKKSDLDVETHIEGLINRLKPLENSVRVNKT